MGSLFNWVQHMIGAHEHQVWHLLEGYYQDNPGLAAEPASQNDIASAEQALGSKFSAQYKKFLSLYGGGGIDPAYVYGVKRAKFMPMDRWSVVEHTKAFRAIAYPNLEDMYVVGDEGSGNLLLLDTKGMAWIYDLSDNDNRDEESDIVNLEEIATDFEDLIYRLLTDTLWC